MYENQVLEDWRSTSFAQEYPELFEEVKLSLEKSHDIEDALIKEHIGKSNISGFSKILNQQNQQNIDEKEFVKDMMKSLDLDKQEGERIVDFEQRIKGNIIKKINL